jgi:REP element-mobilizing transposase RayT
MTSPKPLQYGTFYHIYSRGNNRENIFYEDRNYIYFLRLYTTYIEPVAQTFAYSLLRNHFHMIVYIKTIEEQAADVQASNPERDPFSPRSPS